VKCPFTPPKIRSATRAARAEEFREGPEQMDRQEEQIAHELKIIMPANLHKTAPQRRFMPKLPIRHPQLNQEPERSWFVSRTRPGSLRLTTIN